MSGIPYFMGTTALYDNGRNSLERRPISNKIPTPAMGSHESGCPSSFLHKYWDCGVSGEEEKEVLDLPPKTVLLKFYSNCTQKSGLNGVFRGAQNFDTLAERMFE